jgi:hypothetical protein
MHDRRLNYKLAASGGQLASLWELPDSHEYAKVWRSANTYTPIFGGAHPFQRIAALNRSRVVWLHYRVSIAEKYVVNVR